MEVTGNSPGGVSDMREKRHSGHNGSVPGAEHRVDEILALLGGLRR
jgi:hypothetical protein